MARSNILTVALWILSPVLLPFTASARDCPSELGAHLKPLTTGSGLSWTVETAIA